jgi:hypothetical protein
MADRQPQRVQNELEKSPTPCLTSGRGFSKRYLLEQLWCAFNAHEGAKHTNKSNFGHSILRQTIRNCASLESKSRTTRRSLPRHGPHLPLFKFPIRPSLTRPLLVNHQPHHHLRPLPRILCVSQITVFSSPGATAKYLILGLPSSSPSAATRSFSATCMWS